jgi:hypothetical protein
MLSKLTPVADQARAPKHEGESSKGCLKLNFMSLFASDPCQADHNLQQSQFEGLIPGSLFPPSADDVCVQFQAATVPSPIS